MVTLVLAHAADGLGQLDTNAFDAVDRADMHAVGADHYHMFLDTRIAHRDILWGWNLKIWRQRPVCSRAYAHLRFSFGGRKGSRRGVAAFSVTLGGIERLIRRCHQPIEITPDLRPPLGDADRCRLSVCCG